MSANHDHSEAPFGLGLVLNSAFTVFEFIVGIATGSLALIADATHNLTDTLTLVISYIAQRIGKRLPTKAKTYGYGRVTIVAALLNAGILVAVAGFIGYESLERLKDPTQIDGLVVAGVAFAGILINGYIAWQFRKRKHDLNARSAYTNMLYDTLSSVGALIAGLVMALTGWTALDSIIGLVIAAMLLFATFKIIAEALHVLLEGVPAGTDIAAIEASLRKVKHVNDVDDLHVWAISSEYAALSCHLIIDDKQLQNSRHVVEAAKAELVKQFGIHHSTIEIELVECLEHSEHDQVVGRQPNPNP